MDTVNNIAHVGHQNINVLKAAKDQIGVLNTNTRYLHDEIISLSKNLAAKFPKKLSKIYLVNSGSEANELAIRISNVNRNCENFIVMQGDIMEILIKQLRLVITNTIVKAEW